MRAVSFGKIPVQNAGTPVKLGTSFLSANVASADQTISVNSATPFCQDMIPFKMDIDPAGTLETVMVTAISGKTFTVTRGVNGTIPAAHGSAAVVMARFQIAGYDVGVVPAQTSRTYWGRSNMVVASGTGIIKDFWPNTSGAVQVTADQLQFLVEANPLPLTDFAVDSLVNGEGMYVTVWER